LSPQSTIYQQIAAENHKYWQNRFLFGSEYTEFILNLTANWNTTFRVPEMSIPYNNDLHLLDKIY